MRTRRSCGWSSAGKVSPRACCWLLLWLWLCLATEAGASPRVVLELATPEQEREAASVSLAEALEQVDVTVQLEARASINVNDVVTRRLEQDPPLARVWVDTTGTQEVAVYIADRLWERILIRLVPRSENPAVNHEQIAQIVAAAVQALADGARIGLLRREARAFLVPPVLPVRARRPSLAAAPPPGGSWPRLWAGAGYEIWYQSPQLPVIQGGTLQLGVALGELAGAELGLGLDVSFLPGRYASREVEAAFDTVALRFLAVVSSPREQTLRLRAAFGGGLDVVQLEPRLVPGGLEPSPKRGLLFGALRAEVGAELSFARISMGGADARVALAPLLMLELEVTDTRYVLSAPGNERVAFDPLRLQPGLGLMLVLR